MSNKTNPPAFEMFVYMNEKSALNYMKDSGKALTCLESAIVAARKNGDDVSMADIAELRKGILKMQEAVQEAHIISGKACKLARSLGYPPIKDADLQALGAGGHK